MTNTIYTRPIKTNATSVGQRGRTFWSKLLRKRAFDLLPTIETTAAEEPVATLIHNRLGQDQAAWATIRARFDQVAILDILRKRHLKSTGKELSRGEALAALMAAGLETIVNRDEFRSYH